MRTFEQFVEGAINSKPPESEMAIAFRNAKKQSEREQAKLLKYLRVRDGKAVFLPAVADVVPDIERADKTLEDMKAAIGEYLDALGDYDSVQSMTERLLRLKRTADNLDRDVANLSKQAVTRGVERPQDDPAVMDAAVKRDRVAAESTAEIEDLQNRISRAKEIVEGYWLS